MSAEANDPTPGALDKRRDADDALLADLTAPPPLDQAREAYRYWTQRKAELPVYKRAERKEAEQMAARWKQRLAAAERERYGPGLLEQLLNAAGLRWRPNPRRLLAGVSIAAAIVVLAIVVLVLAIVIFWPELRPIIDTLTNSGREGGAG